MLSPAPPSLIDASAAGRVLEESIAGDVPSSGCPCKIQRIARREGRPPRSLQPSNTVAPWGLGPPGYAPGCCALCALHMFFYAWAVSTPVDAPVCLQQMRLCVCAGRPAVGNGFRCARAAAVPPRTRRLRSTAPAATYCISITNRLFRRCCCVRWNCFRWRNCEGDAVTGSVTVSATAVRRRRALIGDALLKCTLPERNVQRGSAADELNLIRRSRTLAACLGRRPPAVDRALERSRTGNAAAAAPLLMWRNPLHQRRLHSTLSTGRLYTAG
jgi:hypothetical protein